MILSCCVARWLEKLPVGHAMRRFFQDGKRRRSVNYSQNWRRFNRPQKMNIGQARLGPMLRHLVTRTRLSVTCLLPESPCLKSAWLMTVKLIFSGTMVVFTSILDSMERVPTPILRGVSADPGSMMTTYPHQRDCLPKFLRCLRLDPTLAGSSLHLDERTSAAPDLSPGVVDDNEYLLREMFNPQHVKDGELLVTAISLKDLRFRGFSVHRMDYVTAESVNASIRERLSKPRTGTPWKDEGVARLQASVVRAFYLDDQQVFVVIDTAREDNRGHASIYVAASGKGEAHARKLRSLLLPLLQKRTSVEQAFESIVGDL